MKVDWFQPTAPSQNTDRVGGAVPPTSDRRPHRILPQGDETRLSVDQQTVGWLLDQVTRTPEIRQERVEALQQAIRDGRYSVSDEEAAAAFSELFE
jgi:flagellar biosynthesis anti-sigma factor FlgM